MYSRANDGLSRGEVRFAPMGGLDLAGLSRQTPQSANFLSKHGYSARRPFRLAASW